MSKCALCKTSLKDDEINVCDKCRLDFLNFKQQLAEKDKEIEEYKTQIKEFCGTKLAKLIDKKEKQIRHQVCDEIREKLEMDEYNTCENTAFCVYLDYLKEILDQIEQGEQQ